MTYSKTQQSLSDNLENTEVLTNPEQFLGPNYQTVLRFWLYFESLTDEQENELIRRYDAIDDDTLNRAMALANKTAIEVIGRDNWRALWFVIPFPTTITYELITMHLLFERGYSLTFVPLIKDL
jgi:hypothetical protein